MIQAHCVRGHDVWTHRTWKFTFLGFVTVMGAVTVIWWCTCEPSVAQPYGASMVDQVWCGGTTFLADRNFESMPRLKVLHAFIVILEWNVTEGTMFSAKILQHPEFIFVCHRHMVTIMVCEFAHILVECVTLVAAEHFKMYVTKVIADRIGSSKWYFAFATVISFEIFLQCHDVHTTITFCWGTAFRWWTAFGCDPTIMILKVYLARVSFLTFSTRMHGIIVFVTEMLDDFGETFELNVAIEATLLIEGTWNFLFSRFFCVQRQLSCRCGWKRCLFIRMISDHMGSEGVLRAEILCANATDVCAMQMEFFVVVDGQLVWGECRIADIALRIIDAKCFEIDFLKFKLKIFTFPSIFIDSIYLAIRQFGACRGMYLDLRFIFDEITAPSARIESGRMRVDGMCLQCHWRLECGWAE